MINDTGYIIANSSLAAAAAEAEFIDPFRYWPIPKRVFHGIMVTMFIIAGFIGNTLVLSAPFMLPALKTPASVFILNLAIADLWVSIFTNGGNLIGIIYGRPWFEEHFLVCQFIGDTCMIFCNASLVSIVCIALNRYVAVCHPVHYKPLYTWRNSLLMALATWLFSVSVIMLPFYIPGSSLGSSFNEGYLLCILDQRTSLLYNFLWGGILVILPILLISSFYLQIFLTIRKQRKRMVHAGEKEGDKKKQSSELALAKTLFITFVAFVVCWTPYMLSIITDFYRIWNPHWHLLVVICAHASSSGMNPFFYGLTNKNFRQAYVNTLIKIGIMKPKVKEVKGGSTAGGQSSTMQTAVTSTVKT